MRLPTKCKRCPTCSFYYLNSDLGIRNLTDSDGSYRNGRLEIFHLELEFASRSSGDDPKSRRHFSRKIVLLNHLRRYTLL